MTNSEAERLALRLQELIERRAGLVASLPPDDLEKELQALELRLQELTTQKVPGAGGTG